MKMTDGPAIENKLAAELFEKVKSGKLSKDDTVLSLMRQLISIYEPTDAIDEDVPECPGSHCHIVWHEQLENEIDDILDHLEVSRSFYDMCEGQPNRIKKAIQLAGVKYVKLK